MSSWWYRREARRGGAVRYGGEDWSGWERPHDCVLACELLGCIGKATAPRVRATEEALRDGLIPLRRRLLLDGLPLDYRMHDDGDYVLAQLRQLLLDLEGLD